MVARKMIIHKNTESNCKRIAKYITKYSIEPEVVMIEKINMMVSEALVDDFNDKKKAYLKLINQNMKGGKVIDCNMWYNGNWYLNFSLKFDE